MKRTLFAGIMVMAAAFGLHQKGSATTHTITVGNNFFNPTMVTLNLGDTVKWVMPTAGFHTTTSSTIPTGAAPWDSVLSTAGQARYYVPTVVGTYDYVCTPHVGMGMIGSFTVLSTTSVKGLDNGTVFSISPNPARSQVTVKADVKIKGADLVDAAGRVVHLQQIGNGTFSLQGVAAGLYLMQIKAENGMAVEKLFVEK